MKKEFTDRNKFVFKAMQHYYKSVHIKPFGNNEFGFCRWIFASDISKLTALSEVIIKSCMQTLERSGKVKRRFVGSGVQQFSLAKFDGFKSTNEYFEFNDLNDEKTKNSAFIQESICEYKRWGNPGESICKTGTKRDVPVQKWQKAQKLLLEKVG